MDERIACCGFARLVGKNVDYLMNKYEIALGRQSKNSTLDVILGTSLVQAKLPCGVQRYLRTEHASILPFVFFNLCCMLMIPVLLSREQSKRWNPDVLSQQASVNNAVISLDCCFYRGTSVYLCLCYCSACSTCETA